MVLLSKVVDRSVRVFGGRGSESGLQSDRPLRRHQVQRPGNRISAAFSRSGFTSSSLVVTGCGLRSKAKTSGLSRYAVNNTCRATGTRFCFRWFFPDTAKIPTIASTAQFMGNRVYRSSGGILGHCFGERRVGLPLYLVREPPAGGCRVLGKPCSGRFD